MEMPELADLIWLFEDEPTSAHEDLSWPVGLHSFRLRRDDRDPTSGEACLTISLSGDEALSIGRLRKLESLTVERGGGREGLVLRFSDEDLDPLRLQTRPVIRLAWDVTPLGVW